MISLAVAAILVICGFLCWRKYQRDLDSDFLGGAVVLWVFGGLVSISAFVAPYTVQLSDFSTVRQFQENVRLYQERRDNLTAVVRVELAKYPEYEKKILGDIRPQIFLNFPTLKSNETIMKTVNDIVVLEDAVYKLRADLLSVQASIFFREISPLVIYVPSYQSFFGEKNPVSLAGR